MIGRRGVIAAAFGGLVAALTATFAKFTSAEARSVGSGVRPGALRIRSLPNEKGFPAMGVDTKVEVLQTNGEWVPMDMVGAVDISIRPDGLVTVDMRVFVHDLQIENIHPAAVREERVSLKALPGDNAPADRLDAQLRELEDMQRRVRVAMADAHDFYADRLQSARIEDAIRRRRA